MPWIQEFETDPRSVIHGLTLAMGDVLPSRRAARVGRRALAVTGLALLALGFKTDPTSGIKTWHGAIHAIAFLVLLVSALTAMFAIWRSRWPRLSTPSLALATIALVAIAVSFLWASASTVVGSVSLLALLVWIALLALAIGAGDSLGD